MRAYVFCERALHGEMPYKHRTENWDENYDIAFGDETAVDAFGQKWKASIKALEEYAEIKKGVIESANA